MPAAQATFVETDNHPSLRNVNFTIYPNPTSANFTLEVKGEIPAQTLVEIYNMRGERMLTAQMTSEKQHAFATGDLPAGVYFVKIVAGDYTETIKLIRTR
jgi:hypothetical protein